MLSRRVDNDAKVTCQRPVKAQLVDWCRTENETSEKSLSGLENCPKSFRLISFNQEDVMEKLPFYNWGKNPFRLAIFTPVKVWAKHFRKAFDSHGFFWYILNWFCSARVTNQEPHLLLVEPISYALYLRVNVRKCQLRTPFLRLFLETRRPFYVVKWATRRSSCLQGKGSSFISQLF